ncbi:MAG: ABC transporter substrate-binding protein [Actinomycetota bacterium]
MNPKRLARAAILLVLAACTSAARTTDQGPIRLGALYPMSGVLDHYGNEELRGVQIAVELFNARGGLNGRKVELITADAPDIDTGWREAHRLANAGVPVIFGSYSSTLSLAASEAAHREGVLYWETGAVADLVTGRGYGEVFRMGPSGAVLSAQAAGFATEVLAPRFDIATKDLKMAVVYENDPYGSSVGAGIKREAEARGFRLVGSFPYEPATEDFAGILASLEKLQPDIVVAASYLHDGARFRERLVASGLKIKALIGKCAAFYTAEMAKLLGPKITGIFVSDKPMDISPTALTSEGQALAEELRSRYLHRFAGAPEAAAYMGFSGAWALLAHALPNARSLAPADIAAAARAIDVPNGSLPNGAGIRFAPADSAEAGQNLRAFGVVWQWQDGKPVLVWPPSAARGAPQFS